MPKKLLVIFGLVIVVFTMLVLYLFKNDKKTTPKKGYVSADWKKSFAVSDKTPNGIFLFNELLEFQTKKTSVIIDTDIDSTILSNIKTSYFFVGDTFQLKTEEFDAILEKIKKGSNLFIAYNSISENIHSHFFNEKNLIWEYDDHIDVFAKNKNFRFYSVYESDTICSEWNFFPKNNTKSNLFDQVSSESSVQGFSNYLNFKLGKGHIFLHSNPNLFVNYQLLSKSGFEYSQFVVEKIPKEHEIKWLEIARYTEIKPSQEQEGEGLGQKDSSYLQFIFQSKTLTVALLISILGILLFLIFRTKRSEPFIPYIPKSFNHSLIFADTIKEIYYKQQTPYNILQVMKKNLYVAVNKQFFIDISKENKEQELHILHEKSGVPKQKIDDLISKLETKVASQVDFEYLQFVSKAQQDFYLKSGIIKSKIKEKIDTKTKIIHRKMVLPIILITLGITLILSSFYFLHHSLGSAILFWPLGLSILFFGIRLFGLPIIKIENDYITFHNVFSKAKKLKIEDINTIELKNNISIFTFSNGKKFTINHSDMSIYDKNKYQQFISPYINDQL